MQLTRWLVTKPVVNNDKRPERLKSEYLRFRDRPPVSACVHRIKCRHFTYFLYPNSTYYRPFHGPFSTACVQLSNGLRPMAHQGSDVALDRKSRRLSAQPKPWHFAHRNVPDTRPRCCPHTHIYMSVCIEFCAETSLRATVRRHISFRNGNQQINISRSTRIYLTWNKLFAPKAPFSTANNDLPMPPINR